jgi:hypothetical protein
MVEEFASPPEEKGPVIASPVSLPGEFSIGSIREGFSIEVNGKNPHREERAAPWIAQGPQLRGAPEKG